MKRHIKKFLRYVILSLISLLFLVYRCAPIKNYSKKKQVYYFNSRDTLTQLEIIDYFKDGKYIVEKKKIPVYRKSQTFFKKDTVDFLKNPFEIKKGELTVFFIRNKMYTSEQGRNHKKIYIPKDSLANYEIIKLKNFYEGNNIMDFSNPDSIFLYEVRSIPVIFD